MELIKKVQVYQRKLIEKTEEVQRLGLENEEKKRQYEEMQQRLARHPGLEVLEKLSIIRTDSQNKTI